MQLLVRVLNKYDGSDPQQIATHTARGDVIDVVEDDHQWGRLDLTSPSWVVLHVPISRAEAEAMKVSEDPEGNTPDVRVRAFSLDLDALIARGYVGIPTREQASAIRDRYEAQATQSGTARSEAKHNPANASWTEIVDVSAEDFRAARTRKLALPDPMIIR